MLALYRSGRQAEALDAYRDTHRTLSEELGIAPGPALQELERAILSQAAELARPSGFGAEPAAPAPVAAVEQPTVVDPADAEPATEQQRRKTVTILIAERPSTEGSELEAQRRLADSELEATTAVVERHGGSVESVLGAQVMAVFGVPLVHEDDAVRAVRAAAELSEEIHELARPGLDRAAAGPRIGIATGEVLVGGDAGDGAPLIGAPVAVAAELATAAATGEILIAEGTRALLGRAVRTEIADRERSSWRLIDVGSEPPPLAWPPAGPLVGRGPELTQLTHAVERAAATRTVHLFTILGVAGIGKSRLAEELAARVGAEATVVAGRCLAYGEGITFWPLREIAEQLVAGQPLAETAPDQDRAGHVARRAREALLTGEPAISREEIFIGFRELLESAARQRPSVVVFEDVHWAEPTLLDLIEYLSERGRGAPLLVLCLARPELLEQRPSWGGGMPNATSILLERLSDAAAEKLIARLAPTLPEATRSRVLDAAEGNPLFLGQILALLSDRETPTEEVPIPATIQALLAARLDRLGPGERAVIERGAVIGKELWAGAVAELMPDDARPFVERHLEALVRKELLTTARSVLRGERAFAFHHILIQKAAYRAVPKELRASLHVRFGDWLQRVAAADEYAEIAGFHLEQAHRLRLELGIGGTDQRELAARAADRLALAGRRAFDRGDMPASAGLLQRAAALLEGNVPERSRLLSDLGYALFEIGEFGRADAVLSEAQRLARALGDRAVECSAEVKRGNIRIYTDPPSTNLEELGDQARRAIDELTALGDDAGLSRAWTALSEVLFLGGQVVEAAEATQLAADHARRAGSLREEAWALGEYGFCLFEGPTPADAAISELERVIGQAEGNPIMEANMNGFLALQEALAGRLDEARRRVTASLDLTRDLGLRWQTGIHSLLSAYVALLAGDPAAAEREMLDARAAFLAIGDAWFLSTIAVDLPRPVYRQGRFGDAQALVDAIDEWPAPADLEWQIKRRGVRSLLLAREGRDEQALALATEAIGLASESELLLVHGEALLDLAELHEIGGRSREAATAAAAALRIHEQKGNVVGATAARALIDRLQRR